MFIFPLCGVRDELVQVSTLVYTTRTCTCAVTLGKEGTMCINTRSPICCVSHVTVFTVTPQQARTDDISSSYPHLLVMDAYPAARSSTSHTVQHHPYFTPDEIEHLSEKQRGKLSTTQEEKARQQACAFMEAVGSKIGL